MPPKSGMSQAQKLEKIVQYFRESATCHTLEDLEKTIPAAMKVNKMQVEKIGSGSWYWAWAGEELSEKKNTIARLEDEESGLRKSTTENESDLTNIRAEQTILQGNGELKKLLEQLGPLEDEVRMLGAEKDTWECAFAGGIDDKKVELDMLKTEAIEFTSNICELEESLTRRAGLDRDGLAQLRMQCYGDSFVEGEELLDLDEI